MEIKECRLVDLPKVTDRRGNLSFAQQWAQIPFEIRRCYWIYDVPGGEERGGHAYRDNDEFIIALSGSFDVIVDDGQDERTFSLNRSYFGLYVPKGIWRKINNFSTNSVALELGSSEYDENDYIRNYGSYKKMRKDGEI